MDIKSHKIGFVGAGNIAKAIGLGLIKAGIVDASNVMVSAPSQRSFAEWKALGVITTHDNKELCQWATIIFLCMKPYQFEAAARTMTGIREKTVIVSTMAGISIHLLNQKLSGTCGIIRAMPNTPLLVGAGCTVLADSDLVKKHDMELVQKLFQYLGKCEIIPEHLIPAAIGVAGSSPAFIYTIIEAMADAAVKGGLPRDHAQTFAAQAVMGAAKMVLETGQHPGQLKDAVCSPGGTTIYGIEALEKAGIRAAIMSAVVASTQRSEEMSKLFNN